MNRCVLILPYFGEFSNYFPLFLKTCGSNKDYDFLIVTDNTKAYDYPDNVQVVSMSFKDFKNIAAEKLGFSPCVPKPYKLCDFNTDSYSKIIFKGMSTGGIVIVTCYSVILVIFLPLF